MVFKWKENAYLEIRREKLSGGGCYVFEWDFNLLVITLTKISPPIPEWTLFINGKKEDKYFNAIIRRLSNFWTVFYNWYGKYNDKILKDLKFVVFCVFYMTFYNLQNYVKLHQNEGNGMPGNIDLKMLPGGIPRTRPDVSCAFVARFVPPPTFLTQVPPLIPGKLPARCWDTRSNLISPPPLTCKDVLWGNQ